MVHVPFLSCSVFGVGFGGCGWHMSCSFYVQPIGLAPLRLLINYKKVDRAVSGVRGRTKDHF